MINKLFFKLFFFWPGRGLPPTCLVVSIWWVLPTCALWSVSVSIGPQSRAGSAPTCPPRVAVRGLKLVKTFALLLLERNTSRHHGLRILLGQGGRGRGRLRRGRVRLGRERNVMTRGKSLVKVSCPTVLSPMWYRRAASGKGD